MNNMKVQIEYRYNNDKGYCRDFVCDETNMPTPGMKVKALVSYATLVSIQYKNVNSDGLKHYIGLIKEDDGKSSNGKIYNF